MKTHEEIKKALVYCNTFNNCQNCPYDKDGEGWGCVVERNADPLPTSSNSKTILVNSPKRWSSSEQNSRILSAILWITLTMASRILRCTAHLGKAVCL